MVEATVTYPDGGRTLHMFEDFEELFDFLYGRCIKTISAKWIGVRK